MQEPGRCQTQRDGDGQLLHHPEARSVGAGRARRVPLEFHKRRADLRQARRSESGVRTGDRGKAPEREEYQGFVPLVVLLPGKRIEGKAWKAANRRLLQHIEKEARSFLPIVEARVYDLCRPRRKVPVRLPVVAVNTRLVTEIIPGDMVKPVAEKTRRTSVRDPNG